MTQHTLEAIKTIGVTVAAYVAVGAGLVWLFWPDGDK